MVFNGKRMYVYNAVGGVAGVSAGGDDTGKLLWVNTEWSPATTAASPLFLGNNEIAVFGSYGAGGARIKIYSTVRFLHLLRNSTKQQTASQATSRHQLL